MNTIVDFYEKYDEESRLTTNNSRKVEFTVTTTILKEYIKPQDKILELGAGAGVYSFYFAEKGNSVVATDITSKHIDIINEKLAERRDKINLIAEVLDARDLSKYPGESFDMVLCMGPMYHLVNSGDRERCIKEALRVLKKDGVLAIAYINKHFILNSVMGRDKKFLTHDFVNKIMDTGVIREGEKECFWTDAFFTTPIEIEDFVVKLGIEIIDHVSVDGLSPLLRDFVDDMNEEEYDAWLHYIIKSCRDRSIMGMSNHGLLICRK